MKNKTWIFELYDKGDSSVGINPVNETITMTFEFGDWDDETKQVVKEALQNAFGMKCMTDDEAKKFFGYLSE